jgi:hypothetical protein
VVTYVANFKPNTHIDVADIEETFQAEIQNGTAFSAFTIDPESTSFEGKLVYL